MFYVYIQKQLFKAVHSFCFCAVPKYNRGIMRLRVSFTVLNMSIKKRIQKEFDQQPLTTVCPNG